MSNFVVKYHGGIDTNDRNLTGSCSVLSIDNGQNKKIRVMIDFGMYQGTKNDNTANLDFDESLLSVDYLILTHAHMDHCGRIPLLVKKGFNGKIIMTELTKKQSELMLKDYVRLVSEAIEEVKQKNKKIIDDFNYHLKIKNLSESLLDNGTNRTQNKSIKNQIKKLSGNQDFMSVINKSLEYLSKHGVDSKEDVEGFLEKPPVLLYTYEDIEKTLEQVEILEVGEKKDIERTFYIFDKNNPYIDKIPTMVASGFKKQIFIHPSLKNHIIEKWESLLDEFKIHLSKNIDKEKLNNSLQEDAQQLKRELVEAYTYIKDVEEGVLPGDKNYLENCKALLKDANVTSIDDIDNYKPKLLPLYRPPFTKEDIEKAKSLLVSDLSMINNTITTDFRLRFLDAGHIEGSVQALITVTDKKVVDIIESGIPKKELDIQEKNFLFSGDLGRTRDPNLAGTPEIPNKKIDYYQIESTYAGRNHPEKQRSLNDFFRAISNAPGKVIIPAFSMQRTQEVLMILLEKRLESLEYIKGLKKINAEKKDLEKKISDSKISLEEKELTIKQIKKLEEYIEFIKPEIFDYDIIVDSPLSQGITEIYTQDLKDKFDLLRPSTQKKLFGRVVVRYLEKQEHKKLYTPENRNKKQIIISSSGMCQGGSVQNHLEENLENRLSTIVFVGYTPPTTTGGKIKQRESVIINGKPLNVICRIEDIAGFSGHIDEQEILDHLNKMSFSRNATIALTHGGYSRFDLAEKIRDNVLKTSKKVSVIIPKLGGTIKFND